jgi:hypothetical protein
MENVPWFWPGLLISIIVGVLAAPAVARRLAIGPIHAAILVASFGLIVAATLTPLRPALESGAVGTGVCDLTRFGPPPLRDLLGLNDTTLNLVLFAPLGAAIALLPQPKPRRALLAIAVGLPFAIETIQLLTPVLDRGCQSADVVDNLTGLIVGFVAGAVWRSRAGRGRGTPPAGSTSR